MKATVNREVIFDPVEVVITLETADEAKVFKEMCGHDWSVPEAIYTEGSSEFKLLGKMLSDLLKILTEKKK
jgi:hypothetical protein